MRMRAPCSRAPVLPCVGAMCVHVVHADGPECVTSPARGGRRSERTSPTITAPSPKLGGDDSLESGPGEDQLIGMGGEDDITSGPGDDTAFGGPGVDHVNGEPGNDTLFGNFGSDVVSGGPGDDFIDGDNPFPSPPGPLPFPPGGNDDDCTGGPGLDVIANCETTTQ